MLQLSWLYLELSCLSPHYDGLEENLIIFNDAGMLGPGTQKGVWRANQQSPWL